MAYLFKTSTGNISLHLKHIFEEEELSEKAATEESSLVRRVSKGTQDSFEAIVLRAVNLGDDAYTVGAVAGQIAGAYYG
jgi:ADP-ribosylglycohydrolase